MLSLNQILLDTNSYLDLTASLPTGDDLTVRVNYANQATREWADSYQWRQLKSTAYLYTGSGASISLPSNFRSLLGPPHEVQSGALINSYPEIMPEERYSKDSSAKFSFIYGNPVTGYNIQFTNIASGATVAIDYQRLPSSMATYTDMSEIPDTQYIKLKIISYVLQSRSDERFPIKDAEANRILQNMIGREMIQRPGGFNTVRRIGSSSWRLGTARGV